MHFNAFSQIRLSITVLTSCLFSAFCSLPAAEQEPADAVAPAAKVSAPTEEFVFGGGDLRGLIEQLKKHFGVDLFDLATIEIPLGTRVPKMRVGKRPTHAREKTFLVSVLEVYNSLAEHGFPRLGKWHWQGGTLDRPEIVTLTGSMDASSRALTTVKLRVFSVRGLSEAEREKLVMIVDEAAQLLDQERERVSERFGFGGEPVIRTSIRINESTDLLLATGSEAFLEVVEEVMREYRSNRADAKSDPKPPKSQESDFKKP